MTTTTPLTRRRLLAGLTTAGALSLSGCMNAITEEPAYSYDLATGIEATIASTDASLFGITAKTTVTVPERGEYWLRASALVNGVSEAEAIEVSQFYEHEPTAEELYLGVNPRNLDTIHLTVEPYTDQPTSISASHSVGGA